MSLEALHRVLWHPVSAEGALGMFASSCYDFYWAHQPALLCPHRLTRETASQAGAPALCTEKSDWEYLMISTFYLTWWQIATQYCTITQSTLLMKPYKCHSAEVYALPDFTAPSSSRRENTCAGPGLALTLYLEPEWRLESSPAPGDWRLETQTMLQCSPPPAQAPGCLVLCAMQNWSFPSEFCRVFSTMQIMNWEAAL